MDKSDAKRVVFEHVHSLAEWLVVQEWDIDLEFGHNDTGYANCRRDYTYRNATIRFDHDSIGSDQFLIDCLFHELCHLVLAPFDQYHRAAEKAVEGNEIAKNMLEVSRRLAVETSIKTMELAWKNHGREAYLERFTAP